MAVAADWLDQDDVTAAMPNILTSIPAMAVLKIMNISAERSPGEEVIHWGSGEDEVVCHGYDTDQQDGVAQVFWPKLMNIKCKLEGLPVQEKEYMMVKLCAVGQEDKPMLEQELTRRMKNLTIERLVEVNRVCSLVNSLVLALLRVREMQDRLNMMTNY